MQHTLKKLLALFLAVLMLVLCTPLAFADDVVTGDCGDHVTYTWNKGTGAVTISGSGPMWDYDDWINPSPFNESWNVRAIVIESGVTSVGECAFSFCIYLQDVSFPYGLETIGKGAFLSTGLKNASLPRTVTRIGELAFHCADLVSVTLPKGLTAIQNSAFCYNEDLQTLNYTGSPADWDAITIGEDAFEDTPLSTPTCYYYGVDGAMNAIDAIGENDGSNAYLARIAVAAVACMNLTDAEKDMLTNVDVLHAALITVPDYSFDIACGDLVGSAINWSTQEVIIGGFGPMRNDAAFQSFFENNPIAVKTLAVTEGVTGVATRMFKNCDQLESVTLPMSMKTIDQRAFAGCGHLNTINYPGGPADWNKIIIAADAFDSALVSEPTCYYYGVEGAMNAINDIGDVEYTDECKARIDEARKAYDRLSDYETTLVTNYAALTKAEEDYAALEARTDTGKALQLGDRCAVPNVKGAQQSCVYFGNYKQSGNKTDGFNNDPIKWRVLSNADGRLFLLADQNLDVVRYNEERTSVTWKTCTLRAWLNGYDGNPYGDSFNGSAFSGKEAAAIAETAVVNDDNPTYGTDGGENTTDRVFLLSIAEAKTTAYGFTDDNDNTNTRKAVDTGYARSGGHTGYTANRYNWWWLRSPGYQADSSSIVDGNGYLSAYGDRVSDSDAAVRPAFNLNLNSVLFTSAAVNGKAGDGALTAVGSYTENEWKLTLLDESRMFAVTETAFSVNTGDTVTLTYTGATVGTNEYISAILTDETGAALYYGRLSQPDAANGTLTVTVPADLTSGSYTLKVFSEQYNGDKKTDFAGAFCDVALSVTSLLDLAKAAAKAELDSYKDPADYRADEQAALAAAISAGKDAIDAAADSEAVATALTNAKAALDEIKTDAQLTAEELAADKAAFDEYKTAQKDEAEKLLQVGDSDACATLVETAKKAIDDLAYNEGANLAANKSVIDAIIAQLTDDLAAQRASEGAATPYQSRPCPICGKTHSAGGVDNMLGEFHWYTYMFKYIFYSFLSIIGYDAPYAALKA